MDCVIFLCYIYVSNWSDLVSQCFVMQGLFLFAFFTSFIVSETLCKRQNGQNLVTLVTLETLRTLRTLRTIEKQWQIHGNYFCTTMNHNEPFEPLFLFRLLESQIDSQVIHCLYLPYICSNPLRSSFHPCGRRTAP